MMSLFTSKYSALFVTVFFCCLSYCCFSQNDSTNTSIPKKPQIIITNDGGIFIGFIEAMNDREVTIVTRDKGRVIIPKYAIKTMEPITEDNLISGEYVGENHFVNKYFLANSALPINKGEFFVSTIYYVAASLDYGVSDKVSIGLSTTLYGMPMILDLKTSFKIGKKLYLGPELHLGWLWALPNSFFTYGAMKLTQGTPNNNFTFSGGYFVTNLNDNPWRDNNEFSQYYFMNASLTKRLSPRLALIAEAWGLGSIDYNKMLPGALAIVGLKTMKKEKSSWTFSLATLLFQDRGRYSTQTYIIPIPIIGWSGRL